ncbi:MAG: hypothetical protein P8J91_05760 [Pirellulaceae bacterium]|nr:hypothetical protein [Pirellulaceae bacterium]MDG2103237.1 hypothetical protein [Pirellulaceae bacterium]
MDNTHLTLWHATGSQKTGPHAGWGVAFNAQKQLNESWLTFLRLGYLEGDQALLQTVVSSRIGF